MVFVEPTFLKSDLAKLKDELDKKVGEHNAIPDMLHSAYIGTAWIAFSLSIMSGTAAPFILWPMAKFAGSRMRNNSCCESNALRQDFTAKVQALLDQGESPLDPHILTDEAMYIARLAKADDARATCKENGDLTISATVMPELAQTPGMC